MKAESLVFRYLMNPLPLSKEEYEKTDLFKLLKLNYKNFALFPRELTLDINYIVFQGKNFFNSFHEKFGYRNTNVDEDIVFFCEKVVKNFLIKLLIWEKTKDVQIQKDLEEDFNFFFASDLNFGKGE